MTENEVARIIVDAALAIHKELGPGLPESAYQCALAHELKERGLWAYTKQAIPLIYKGEDLGKAYETDLTVEDLVIVEIKSVRALEDVYFKQLLTYLRLADLRLGLLINFNEVRLQGNVRRVVNGLREE